MSLIKINPVAGKTYQDAWNTFDANVDESITDLDTNGSQFRLKKFDGTYTSFKSITFPVATAANGLTLVGTQVRLGGTLTGGTTIDTATFNFLIQSGTTAQKIRCSNTFAEINGALELRISPPSIDASTAIVDQVLKVKNAATGRCEYEYIKSSDFTSLSIVSNKVRLTFKDASFIETGSLANTIAQTNTAVNYAVGANDEMIVVTVNNKTITLPAAPDNGRQLIIKAISASGGSPVIVDGNGINIDGVATKSLVASYSSLTIVYNAALNNWLII